MIILYTTGCPQCRVLAKKLDAAGLIYQKETDVNNFVEKNFFSAPMLEVDGKIMDFKAAVNWLNGQGNHDNA